MSLIGTDVSFYQDDPTTAAGIDFVRMREGGAAFTIIRAGQNLWEDNEFDISWKAAKGILPRGSYFFYDSRVDPKQQARKYISCFADKNDLGELPLWCDFEDTYNGAFGGWKNWYTFIEELKTLAPGKQIGIYTGYYYWRENTIGKAIPAESLNYFKQYPLWVAAYNLTGPDVPEPWTSWTLWQFTDNGNGALYGVESGNVDLNRFEGTLEEFRALFGLTDSLPNDGNGDASMTTQYSMIPLSSGTRLRADHNTFAGVINSYDNRDIIQGDEMWTAPADGSEVKKGDQWLHVTHVNGIELAEDQKGWMAYIHKGYPICGNLQIGSAPVEETPTANVNADVHISIRDGKTVGVTVDGDTWVKQA